MGGTSRAAVMSGAAAAWCLMWGAGAVDGAEFAAVKNADGTEVEVRVDGQLFTRYVTKSGTKPILYPLLGPTGKAMTRAYPMEEVAGEKRDHIHQRSLWFTQEHVNGHDFWAEPASTKEPKPRGSILHQRFRKVEGGEKGVIETENLWVDPSGKPVLTDVRTVTLFVDGDARLLDFDVTMFATHGPVEIGDTKEGTFGMRVPTSMDVDSKLGGKIVNSEGEVDAKAWGRPAKWVDYHGPVGGETLGAAILNHPASDRFPTRWHVRTYGLFAANPFGNQVFDTRTNPHRITHIEAGKSLTFHYRVVLHAGDEKQARIHERFEAYAAEKRAPHSAPQPADGPKQ